METRVQLQPAYVLHTRPFRNTSLLVDFFTYDYGRVTAVARGARRAKSPYRSLLQAFHPLLISFSGRGEVKTVGAVETSLAAIVLKGERLFSGLYVNELLSRLLHNHEEHTGLYRSYQDTVIALQGADDVELLLRRFELQLLSELGYAINLQQDYQTHQAIEADAAYRFTPDIGFEKVAGVAEAGAEQSLFQGHHLIALREDDLTDPQVARSAKRLLRMALAAHLGERPLNSRELFQARRR